MSLRMLAIATNLVALIGLSACGTTPTAGSCAACIDFEAPLAAGTRYGSPTQTPGTTVLVSGGVKMSVESFLHPSGTTSFNSATVTAAAPGTSSGQALSVNNINLKFATLLAAKQITFDFFDLGGHENLSINGASLNPGELAATASVVNGVNVLVLTTPVVNAGGVVIGKQGRVRMQGQIKEFIVGGQEFALDNICFEY